MESIAKISPLCKYNYIFLVRTAWWRRSRWPRGLRRRSATVRLLRLWVRIPPGHGRCCECFVMSGRSLCDELITRPEESYWLCCVVVCDLETLWMRRLWPTGGCRTKNKTLKEDAWQHEENAEMVDLILFHNRFSRTYFYSKKNFVRLT